MTNIVKRQKKELRPTLEEVLNNLGPLPTEAVLMGVVEEDGLPLLFDTHNWSGKVSPNILIWNGETSFLKVVAEFILSRDESSQLQDEIEFVVFTNNVEEWDFLMNKTSKIKNSPCIGVIPFWSDVADQVLLALASWVHDGFHPNHSVVVLIEGIDNILKLDFDAKQNFNYILVNGGNKRVFAVGTVTDGKTLYGLQELFKSQGKYESDSDRYRFPEGYKEIEVWLPKTEI